MVGRYTAMMEAYDVTKAARNVSEFTIDQLSNWYVRRNRRRFWKSEKGKDKTAAYQTLFECLDTIARLIAPFAPFLAEEIFRNLNSVSSRDAAESVHLASMPEPDASMIDAALEERMDKAERIVMLVRAMRMKSNIKVRQPLRRVILPIADAREREEIKGMADIILDEINVKTIEYVSDESGLVRKKSKPNFKTLGPKFGKSVQGVAARLKDLSADEIASLESKGSLSVDVGGELKTIGREDVEIIREDIQGWLVESDGTLTVALDTALDDDLVAEGAAREFVNRVQNMRKDAGFLVTDRIGIYSDAPDSVRGMLMAQRLYIQTETLASEFSEKYRDGEYHSNIDLNGVTVRVGIERRPQL